MDFFSHIFWAWLPTKNKLWKDEALFFAILPDLGFLLILLYVFATPGGFWTSFDYMPKIYLNIYYFLHSFVALAIAAGIVFWLRPKMLPALSGWFIHLMLDIPFHENPTFSTRFLYPIFPDTYVTGISWFDVRFLGASYLAILLTYIYINHRETMRQRLNGEWKPDLWHKLDCFFGNISEWVLSKRGIKALNVPNRDCGRPSEKLSGQDRGSVE